MWAAEVDVAVFEPDILADIDVLLHGEGRSLTRIQEPKLFHHDLDLAGRDARVDGLLRAGFDQSLGGDDVLGAEILRLGVEGSVALGAKDELGNAFTVAEVDEDDAAEVPAAVDPSHQEYALALIGRTKGTAVVGTAKLAEKIERGLLWHETESSFRW
jgi:hypothetical protein